MPRVSVVSYRKGGMGKDENLVVKREKVAWLDENLQRKVWYNGARKVRLLCKQDEGIRCRRFDSED